MTNLITLIHAGRVALQHAKTHAFSLAQSAIANRALIVKNAAVTLVATSVFSTLAFPQFSYAAPLEMHLKSAPLKLEVEDYAKLASATEAMSKKRTELSLTRAEINAQIEAKKLADEQARLAAQAAEAKKAAEAAELAKVRELAQKRTASTSTPTAPRVQTPYVGDGRVFYVTVTAYNSEVAQTDGDPWTTAAGTRTRDGVIALNGVPFGTKVKFPQYFGDKIFTVEDRTSSRYGKFSRADIWMLRKTDALKWGIKRNVQLVVVK